MMMVSETVARCAKCGKQEEDKLKRFFYFMRHGRTAMNGKSLSVGSIDEPMNETGLKQSEEVAEKIKNSEEKINLIISSPMKRAMQTAKIIAEKISIEIMTDNRLRERKSGILEGKPETLESDAKLLLYDYLPEGAEPLESFEKETREFLQDALKNYDDKNVLFVTHGFRMLIIIKLIHGWDVEKIMKYTPPGNCEIVKFAVVNPCQICKCQFAE